MNTEHNICTLTNGNVARRSFTFVPFIQPHKLVLRTVSAESSTVRMHLSVGSIYTVHCTVPSVIVPFALRMHSSVSSCMGMGMEPLFVFTVHIHAMYACTYRFGCWKFSLRKSFSSMLISLLLFWRSFQRTYEFVTIEAIKLICTDVRLSCTYVYLIWEKFRISGDLLVWALVVNGNGDEEHTKKSYI